MIISMDTNIFIFGIRERRYFPALILANLDEFEIKIARQVDFEVRRNLSFAEIKIFYALINQTAHLEVGYEFPPGRLIEKHRQAGLKKGDISIAAFCEWEGVGIFVSENRHFLQSVPNLPFRVLDAEAFCREYALV